jgi:lipopolysaccharide/colanic/teichoic acid biosynthesis glycosyltransferase
MPKFRTMRIDAPAVATHLLSNPDPYVTPVGHFLRRSSLDELPIPVKIAFNEHYLKHRSFLFDLIEGSFEF